MLLGAVACAPPVELVSPRETHVSGITPNNAGRIMVGNERSLPGVRVAGSVALGLPFGLRSHVPLPWRDGYPGNSLAVDVVRFPQNKARFTDAGR